LHIKIFKSLFSFSNSNEGGNESEDGQNVDINVS